MLTLAAATLILQVTLDARSMVADLPVPGILAEVRELWKPYLEVVFRTEADPEIACDGSLRLLITDEADAAREARRRTPLGWIEFVDHEQPAQSITVSAGTARMMQHEGRWLGRPLAALPPVSSRIFLVRALGRAIAHEIGHYVLRSTAHSSSGLMRPRFSVPDIMDTRREHFRLGRDEAARLTALQSTTKMAPPFADRVIAARLNGGGLPMGQLCPTDS